MGVVAFRRLLHDFAPRSKSTRLKKSNVYTNRSPHFTDDDMNTGKWPEGFKWLKGETLVE
jgi:hypothetical protein